MLPLIIGGVALAATGYGVKKFFENDENQDRVKDAITNGCDWILNCTTSDYSPFLNMMSDPYFLFCFRKKKIKEALKDAFVLLQEIQNNELLPHLAKVQNFHFEQTPDIEIFEEETKAKMREFCKVLLSTHTYYMQILDELNAIVLEDNNYTEYADDTKEKVYKLTMLTIMLHQTVSLLSQFNYDSPNRTTIRAFERLKRFLQEEMVILKPEK